MIIDRIYEWARIEPSRTALIHNDSVIDYITFAKAIEAFRTILERQQLPAGTLAVVLVSHLADAWALVMALRSIGLTTIHVPSLAQAKSLGIKNVSCVITTAREQPMHDLVTNPLDGAKPIVVSRIDLAQAPVMDLPFLPHRNYPGGGHILFTSGTTGTFKKLLWDSKREDAIISERSQTLGVDKHAVLHVMQYEQQTSVGWKFPLCAWDAGGCVVFDQRPDRFEQFFRRAFTIARMTPGIFQQLVNANNSQQVALPSPRKILVGGGSLGSDLITKALAKFGPDFSVYYDYVSTEINPPTLFSRIQNADDALWLEAGTYRTVQVIDESGRECLSHQEGDLRILTTELDFQSYLDDQEATSRVFRDGYFYPGDRAVRRADGRIRILGRVADVLNVRGDKIAVGPIEQRIQRYLNVDEICVFSGLNDMNEVELAIAIQSDGEPAQEKLDAIKREFINFDKVRFFVLREFPRTQSGTEKVSRSELRKLVFSPRQ